MSIPSILCMTKTLDLVLLCLFVTLTLKSRKAAGRDFMMQLFLLLYALQTGAVGLQAIMIVCIYDH